MKSFVIGALFLSLTACVGAPTRDDLQGNALRAMVDSLRRDAEPRHYPSGKDYCVEEAYSGKDMEDCALAGEDLNFLNTQDKARMLRTAERAVKRVELAVDPCSWWERITRADRCRVE